MFWKHSPTLCKIPSVVSNKHQGLERHSRNPKSEHNTLRDSAKRKRNTRFDCYPGSGIRQRFDTDAGLGKKTDGIQDSDERISGAGILVNKGAGIWDQGPSFQTLKHEQET